MRITPLIFVGFIAALAAFSEPALARNSNSPANANAQTDERSVSQGCHAYQKAPDGSWTEVPCQEVGHLSAAPTSRGKSATRTPDEETR
jgi:hypothetical protein